MLQTAPRSTQERILDTAEQLFAQRGYHGVSLRDITSTSGTGLNLVRYHFGSKDDLFRAVTGRRAEAMYKAFSQSLETAQTAQAPEPLSVAQIVRAHASAFGQLKFAKSGWHNYLKLIVHCDSLADRPELLIHLREGYQPVFERYVTAFEATGMDHESAGWSVHFMHMTEAQLAVDVYSIAHLSNGVCDPTDTDRLQERLILFTTAGLNAFTAARAA